MPAPGSDAEAAELLRACAREGRAVRPRGGGTKARPAADAELELSTSALGEIEHTPGDLTAVLGAGVRLADAQRVFAAEGQMLALDPPLGEGDAATIGGVLASADSGPLRHRYGAPRDLVLGMTVALSDGTVAKAGGRVIKNVAGYDLAKLFTGSLGTLGVILRAAVRLHPVPAGTATAVAEVDDPDRAAVAAGELARAPLELQSLDVAWSEGRGRVLARVAGVAAAERAEAAVALLAASGIEAAAIEDDEPVWTEQRDGQRLGGPVVRVSALPARLADVLRAADAAGARVVGRAGIGTAWLAVDDPDAIGRVRERLAPAPCAVLGAPAGVDPWGAMDEGALAVMRRVKERFDPAGVCNPGVLV